MKKLSVLAFALSGVAATFTVSADSRIEVPVEVALAPSVGYDDNDTIEVVLHGFLPNACFFLVDYIVEKDVATSKYRIRQFAERTWDGICAADVPLPEHMKMAVPFTNTVEVGKLPVGDYDLQFSLAAGQVGTRKLNVEKATKPTINSAPYAAVSTAYAPDIVNGREEVKVILSGVLNSSCTELTQNDIDVKLVNDVFIVRPIVRARRGELCMQVLIPFDREINLGRARPGHYLVHVRTMSGKSVNKVVEVMR